MASSFRISSHVPSGLAVESVIECEDMIKVTARSHASVALCASFKARGLAVSMGFQLLVGPPVRI
jgi:hypothetical protein